jgi:hypothetical protein
MAIIETFSKRQRRLKGEARDVFIYDDVPDSLRVQICHIWKQCLGLEKREYMGHNPIYQQLEENLAAEFGLFSLGNKVLGLPNIIVKYFMESADTEQALDMIEMSFQLVIRANITDQWRFSWKPTITSQEAVRDLNQRFLEHGVGYAFIDGESPQLIRKDNDHLHGEVVMPALRLLHEEGFTGANAEYRKAHEHYRQGSYKECLNECLKAFESTMKTICTKRKWPFKESDTASSLIDTCLKNNLLPVFMQTHLGTIRSALESAIPTLRNKLSGHGQGVQPKHVPGYYAEYLLHETAATIVFLVDAYKALK